MNTNIQFVAALVEHVLAHASDYVWTVQGFGMMRTYLDEGKRFRLNVYHSALRVENVSDVHNHPWHFQSLIVAGELRNIPYFEDDPFSGQSVGHNCVRIKTGEGGGPVGKMDRVWLTARKARTYLPGQTYYQAAPDLHRVEYIDGTVTINDRVKLCAEDMQEALVCWRDGNWVNAEPRPAHSAEIGLASQVARQLMRREALKSYTTSENLSPVA